MVTDLKALRSEIKKEIKQKLLTKRYKKIEKKQEEIAQNLFMVQHELTETIRCFYGLQKVSSNWYIENDSVIMNFRWLDQEMTLRSEDRRPVLEGCPKRLRRYFLRQPNVIEFMLLDHEYSLLYLI